MPPRVFRESVIRGQRVGVRPDVSRALHVVVAAKDVGAAAGNPDVAERELKHAQCANVRAADRMLRDAHAPDDSAGTVLRKRLSDEFHLIVGNAGHLLNEIRCPFRGFLAHLVHAVHAIGDVRLVLPAVVEDRSDDAPDQRNVRAGPDADVVMRLCGGAREARIDDDHARALFLRMQDHLHRHGMCLGRVGAEEHHRLRVEHVVERVRHRAIAERVGNARDGRRMTDARLVIAVVGAPQRHELAQQVRLLVAVLRRSDPIRRVGTAFLADVEEFCGDRVERLVPRYAAPLATLELHRCLQPTIAVGLVARGGALCTVTAEIDRRLERGFLVRPNAVLHGGIDRAADCTMRTDRSLVLDPMGLGARRRLDRRHRLRRQRHGDASERGTETRSLQELAPIYHAG